MRPISIDECEVDVIAHPEETHPKNHIEDEGILKHILAEMEYNEWAWCQIEVRLSYKGVSSSSWLGACSYESKEDFIGSETSTDVAGGYYSDMVDDALLGLNETVRALQRPR